MVPQIKSTVLSVLVILIGAPLAGAYFSWQTGELHNFHELGNALTHGFFGAFMLSIGWVFFRSPFSGRITEVLMEARNQQGEQTKTTVKITEPETPAPPAPKP